MRYLGNKELVLPEIIGLLKDKELLNKDLTFFDAFCGTGTVSNAVKFFFNKVIINDNLNWCVSYASGLINSHKIHFDNLGYDPIDYLNESTDPVKGFFYENYSKAGSERMYFSENNAGKIDLFRSKIDLWKKNKLIDENEFNYLFNCIVEAVSRVSNTAGVYGAFLKKWDARALKDIVLSHNSNVQGGFFQFDSYVGKVEDLVSSIDCDVIYLDPPYTQNQYGTQYHILETLLLNDNPEISKITGSRSTSPMRSDWSKNYKCHILFDKVISSTKAKHIVFSYSSDGFMSKSYIESILFRYGKKETYVCKKINYKKYNNHKTSVNNEHFEYIFYIEKKCSNDVFYESPLNYIGSKSKYIEEIREYTPKGNEFFCDVFGGGFNVGINSLDKKVLYNDINFFVKDLIKSFRDNDVYDYILFLKRIIKKYGLEPEGKEAYLALRDKFNSTPLDKRDPRVLYSLVLYGFQQQLRFNTSHGFNNPCGMRWFNDKVLSKLISFSRRLKELDVDFYSVNFIDFCDVQPIRNNSFFYLDPPYRLTLGSYNDGKRGFHGWDLSLEKKMLNFCKEIDNKGARFMLSYVLEHGGIHNNEIMSFIMKEGYKVIELKSVPGKNRKEVIIVNYEP